MGTTPLQRFSSNPSNVVLLGLAVATFAVHALAVALCAYGYFRDELYYIACTRHLGSGYVDQPPFSIYVLAANRSFLGDSLIALRFLPAVAHALTVLLTGLMARELGGGRFAQTLAAIASLGSPIYLGMDGIFSMNCFDILAWAAAAYVLIRIFETTFGSLRVTVAGITRADPNPPGQPMASPSPGGKRQRIPRAEQWVLLGLILGAGLLNKISVLWLGVGITTGLLLTPHRAWFRTPGPWIAGGIALLLFLPFVIWNLQHDFAHLEFIRNASGGKYASQTALSFVLGQVLLQNPLTFPLWAAGLFFLLFDREGRTFRPLGIAYVVAFLILIVNGHSKPEYLSSSYGMLFAAGGASIDRIIARRRWAWLQPTSITVLLVSASVLTPFTLPLLPVDAFIGYQSALGVAPSTPEGKRLDKLPQFYADMFGWEEKAAAVARVFHSLTPEEQTKCALFAENYGRCGAIDFFGQKYGLPESIGDHNSYWIWGPRQYTGEIILTLGGNPEVNKRFFEEVTVCDTVSCAYCMPYENHLLIMLCRNLKRPINEVWSQIRHFE